MKKILFILVIITTFLNIIVLAQSTVSPINLKPIASDCSKAIKIFSGADTKYGPTVAPDGYGEFEEINSNNPNDKYFFEKEHNSAWYYFDVYKDGLLALKILPTNHTDDYDFLLFKVTDSSFCDDVYDKKIIPVRTNISRTGKGGSEVTGLTYLATKSFTSPGIGDQFSKSIEVKKGDKYYIVLDNVSIEGKGHTIEIGFEKEITISGNVTNENTKSIKSAEVTLEDKRGMEIFKTLTDAEGAYQINTYIIANESYNLVIVGDSTFAEVKVLTPEYLKKNEYKINNLSLVLSKLKGGKKYNLKGLNFYGDSYILLPQSRSSLTALYKVMKKNKKMIIRIEGHINDPYGLIAKQRPGWGQKLSDLRANTVYEYLINKGILKERMSVIGYGSKYMLFPNPKSELEMEKNRRVEINVISSN